MRKLMKYVFLEVIRTRVILFFTLILLAISFSVLALEDNAAKGMISLLNVELILIPLVSILFSTIYIYNNVEFIELIVGQPLPRKSIWRGLWAGVSSSIALAYMVGLAIPLLLLGEGIGAWVMAVIGLFLVMIFSGIGLALGIRIRDKAKGVGATIFTWLFFSIVFDALILFLSFQLSDYPIEKFMVGAVAFNPIDLARVLVILKLDVGAMLGYTGAVFTNYFGSEYGMIISVLLMFAWCFIPYKLGMRWFVKKDF
jgi:Cu-processing system permease protein